MRAGNDQNLFRRHIEHEVERLLALLDTMDGDCDLEENGDEHDVGMPERWVQSARANGQGNVLEDDEDGADDEDGGDTEPNGDEIDSNFSEDGN